MDNKHIFSKEYTEKKSAILDCIEKTETAPVAVKRFPMKAVLAAAIVCVILTTSVIAAGVIGRQFKLNVDYLPEGVEKIVGVEERFNIEGCPSLEFYVVDLEGEEFDGVKEFEKMDAELKESIDFEYFEVNGHYAQVMHFLKWDENLEELPADWDQHTNKQLIVVFEEEDLLVQIWASNLVSMEELKKVAEGLSLEPTDDGNVAVKIHQCD